MSDDGFVRFPSLASLRTAHSELLKRYRESGDAPVFLAQIAGFIQDGQAIGALLYDDADREASQSLLDYWVAVLYRAGREPPDATLSEFDPTLAPKLGEDLCPYLGLEAFRPDEHKLFFGRRHLVEHLVDKLKGNCLLAVVGPSGSGKSSVVLAGLLPMLHAGALPESQGWQYYGPMVPGSNPLANLARLLCPPGVNPTNWVAVQVERLQQSWDHLLHVVTERGPQPVVLVVDQFEEMFTLCTDARMRDAFTANLVRFMHGAGARHRIILTMRSDFEPYLMQLPALLPHVTQGQVRVTALSEEELREAIEKPAERIGLQFERGIVDELVKEILGEPAGLPLLQFTLLKLWEKREGNRVTQEAYRRLGGARLALARSADEFYRGLSLEDQATVKRILLRMVRPSDAFTFTNNRIRVPDLYQLGEDPENVKRVVDKLIKTRLVRRTPGEAAEDDQVEVAHEALVRNWPTLVDWLEDERENLRRRLRLTEAAEAWKQSKEDPSFLWQGRQLEEAFDYRDLNRLESEFVQASQTAVEAAERERETVRQREIAQAQELAREQQGRAEAERQRAIEQERRAEAEQQRALEQQLLAEAERQRADKEAQINNQLRRQKKMLGVAVLIVVALAGYVFYLRSEAVDSWRKAISRERATAAINHLASPQGPEKGIWLGLQAMAMAETSEARDALQQALQALEAPFSLSGHTEQVLSVAFSPDEQHLATASEDGTAKIWNIEARQPVRTLFGHQGPVMTVAYNPNGLLLATASVDGTTRLWDPRTGKPSQHVQEPLLKGHTGPVMSVTFSPQGDRLATTSQDTTARIWDVQTGKELYSLEGHSGPVRGVAFNRDGTLLATASEDKTARIWNVRTRQEVHRLKGHTDRIVGVAFSPDGTLLATASLDETARVWNVQTGEEIPPSRDHVAPVLSVAFSPNGKRLATASVDTTAKVWDVHSGQLQYALAAKPRHTAAVTSIAFSPDGNLLATASADKTVKLWAATAATSELQFSPLSHRIKGLAFTARAARLVTTNVDQAASVDPSVPLPVRVWDVATKQRMFSREGIVNQHNHIGRMSAVTISPHDTYLVTASDDGVGTVWDLQYGQEPFLLNGHTSPIEGMAFHPDGRYLAIGRQDGTAEVWDLASRGKLFTLREQGASVMALAFSQDGHRLITVSEDQTQIWGVHTRRELENLPGFQGPALAVAVNLTGARFAKLDPERTLTVWDIKSRTTPLLMLPAQKDPVIAIAFNRTGTHLATASAGGLVRTYPLEISTLMTAAHRAVKDRVWTNDECNSLLQESPCPSLPDPSRPWNFWMFLKRVL